MTLKRAVTVSESRGECLLVWFGWLAQVDLGLEVATAHTHVHAVALRARRFKMAEKGNEKLN